MSESSGRDDSDRQAVANSANSALAAFIVNYYELVNFRRMFPTLWEIMADVASGAIVPQLITTMMEIISGNAKGLDKNKLQIILNHLQKRKAPVREQTKNRLRETFESDPQVIIHRQIVDRLTVVLAVSHIETYLTDTFKTILEQNPDKVRVFDPHGKATTSYSRGDYESLEEAVIRTHHREINFQDIDKTVTTYQKLGIYLLPNTSQQEQLRELLAKRHLIVHRGGRINQDYLKQAGKGGEKIGDYILIPTRTVDSAMSDIFSLVLKVEEEIAKNRLLVGQKVLDTVGKELVKKVFGSTMRRLSEIS